MQKILGIGNATLDIINIIDHYPQEDSEFRILKQHFQRGGNTTNTLAILSQLGYNCNWAGVLVDEPDSQYILQDLNHYQINYSAVELLKSGKLPTSYILLNQTNGSRTIAHYRDLPEYAYQKFATINLANFNWIHFEGRNIAQVQLMFAYLNQSYPQIPCSLEIEKPRENIDTLFTYPKVLIFSKAYANHYGYQQPIEFLHYIRQQSLDNLLVIAWGEQGAYALDTKNQHYHSPAYPPKKVIDTIGAGDVFNAGIIDGLLKQYAVEKLLQHSCQLAGKKCGLLGLQL